MLNTYLKILTITLCSVVLSACSSNGFGDLFSNYNQQMHDAKMAQQRGEYSQALSLIPERSEGDGTYNLSLLEKARLEYLANNNEQSKTDFEYVYREVQQAEQAAKIQVSRGIEKVSAVVTNDNALRYDIPYYEQSMLHSYQALNYLDANDLSGALVEIRRANLVQTKALKANQKAIKQSKDELAEQGVSSKSLGSKYPSMDEAIGRVKNGFQNAYTFYLSGVLYEAAGQENDAYIDYKKALEIYPHNTVLQKEVWRLATYLAMGNDLQVYSKRFSSNITSYHANRSSSKKPRYKSSSKQKSEQEQGRLIVLVENGIVPSKQEVKINLPIWTRHNDARFYNIAVPVYQNRITPYAGLSINYQDKQYQSQEVVRLQSLAAKQLKDELPSTVARQVVRVIAKEEIRDRMSRQGGDIGNILANIYNIASEKADTRSWSTLPDTVHILRMDLSSGKHNIDIRVNGNISTIPVEIRKDRPTLLRLTSINNHLDYKNYNL